VYAVDRATGQPREGTQILVVRKKDDVTQGVTDKQGLLQLKIEQKKPAAAKGGEEGDEEEAQTEEEGTSEATDSYLVMASSGANIYEQDLPLSTRGTFGGELDLPEETALGDYQINASVGDGSASGSFDVEEYKKPEYKVLVTTPQAFVNTGQKTTFTVSANYF